MRPFRVCLELLDLCVNDYPGVLEYLKLSWICKRLQSRVIASFKQKRCKLSMHKELADKDIKYFIIGGNTNTNSTSATSLQYSHTLRWMNFHSETFCLWEPSDQIQ